MCCNIIILIGLLQIHEIIRQGVEVPEGQNDLRRNQLRELALLNGTLRENDGPRCTNCGAPDHKSWLVCIFFRYVLSKQRKKMLPQHTNAIFHVLSVSR